MNKKQEMTEAQMKAKVKEIDKQRRDLQKQISAIEKVYDKKERQLDSERDKATVTLEAKDSKLEDIESDLEEKIEVIETDRNFETNMEDASGKWIYNWLTTNGLTAGKDFHYGLKKTIGKKFDKMVAIYEKANCNKKVLYAFKNGELVGVYITRRDRGHGFVSQFSEDSLGNRQKEIYSVKGWKAALREDDVRQMTTGEVKELAKGRMRYFNIVDGQW